MSLKRIDIIHHVPLRRKAAIFNKLPKKILQNGYFWADWHCFEAHRYVACKLG